MVFLSPLILLGLLGALIPVGIHLIRKEKPPKLMFSTIRFLKKTSKKLILFQQLQQILLLIMRASVIVLVVIAFARPLINQAVSRLLDADPHSVVILFDNSMSMRYGETFDQATEAAIDVLNSLSGGDEVALVTFSTGPEIVRELSTDIDAIRSAINGMDQAGYGGTSFMPSLRLADQLLQEARYDNKDVYLISDFQEVGFQNIDAGWKLAPGVNFNGIDVGVAQSSNLVLTDVRSPEQLLEDEEEHQILARVRSSGTVHLDQAEVTLAIDGVIVDRAPVDLTDKSEAVVTLTASFIAEGTHVGEITVNGDNFSVDNKSYFTVDVLPKIKVLLVNGEASDNWYDDEGHWFGLAVSSTENSPFELQTILPAELTAASLRQNDVAVLLNVGDLTQAQSQFIANYVQGGGSLFIAPGDRIDPQRFNQQFAGISPARLQTQGLSGRDDYLVIADYDRRHPILQPLDADWSVRFQGHWVMEPGPESDVLMQFDTTEAALVERNVGDGKVILFASSLDLEWNNLPLQGLFLPFVHETLIHLVQPELKQRAYQVGDNFTLVDAGETESVEALNPDGDAIAFTNNNFSVTANMPGFIRANVDGKLETYAVNVLTEESTLARTAVSNVYDAVINPDTSPVQSREVRTAQLMAEIEGPQRLWWWILCLVMLLLLTEAVIANRTYR